MPIQGEQWAAVFALWTEPAVTPFNEMQTVIETSHQKGLQNKNLALFSLYHVGDVLHRWVVHENKNDAISDSYM